jgi:WD40 repeat protein
MKHATVGLGLLICLLAFPRGSGAEPPRRPAEKPLTPAEAAKRVGEKVTVKFTVKGSGSSQGLLYLYSEASFNDDACFLLRFAEASKEKFKKLNILDIGKHFKGETVRVTGEVKAVNFTGSGERLVIDIDAVGQIEVVPSATANSNTTRSSQPIAVLSPAEAAKRAGERVTVEFRVKSTGTNTAGFVMLFSEPSFKDDSCFYVLFPEAVREKIRQLGISDVQRHFANKVVRTTGDVKIINFTGEGKRATITIDNLDQIQIVDTAAQVKTRTGARPALGVSVRATDVGSEPKGLVITGVRKGGGAEKAGIQVGDILVSVNQVPVTTVFEIRNALADHSPGDQVSVKLSRAGQTMTLSVVLESAADTPRLTFAASGHLGRVWGLTFSSDGRQLISIGEDGTIRFWNTTSGETVRVLYPSKGPLYSHAISRDGKWLAVGGLATDDGKTRSILLIDLPSCKLAKVLRGHTNTLHSLAFSLDGQMLASGSRDQTICLWNVATGQKQKELLSAHIWGTAFSPDGKTLVEGSLGGEVRFWNPDAGTMRLKIANEDKAIRCLAWSPDGNIIAVGTPKSVQLVRPDGTVLNKISETGGVYSLAFLADSQHLLIGGEKGTKLVGIKGETKTQFKQHSPAVLAVAVSPDSKMAATGDVGGVICLWNLADGSLVACLGGGRDLEGVAWSADSRSIGWGFAAPSAGKSRGEIERAFSIPALEWESGPNEGFLRAITSRDNLQLEPAGKGILAVKQGTQTVATLETPGEANRNPITAYTLLPGDLAAVADTFNLYLFNTRTGRRVRTIATNALVRGLAPSPNGRYLLYATIYRNLHVYNVESATFVLTLYPAGNEWVMASSQGYYAASPGGGKLLGWLAGNGPDEFSTFHSAAQFRKTFYRPDVIKRLLEAGSIEKALALADQERGKQSVQTEVSDVLPPKVKIIFPEKSGQKIATTKFEVKTSAVSVGGHPVTSLRLLVDGRPYSSEASLRTVRSAKVGEVKESWQVELTPGTYRLTVIAASAVSQSLSDEIEIVVAPDSAPAKPPPSSLHMLAVGINAYPGRMKLDCAMPDAKAITAAFAQHSKGIYQVQSTLLLDKEATRANVLKGIAELEKQAKAGDVTVIFYAGHGDCKLAGQFVMLTVDAQLSKEKLAQTGVTGEEIKARLARLPGTVLLIMDCCYAGSFDASGKKKRALPTEAGDLVRALVSDDQGLVVMCGASKEQESAEETELGHGYFTQSLIEGLAGKAASQRDGLVYLTGLQSYVEERVRELSGDEQFPTLGKPTLIRSFPLAKP